MAKHTRNNASTDMHGSNAQTAHRTLVLVGLMGVGKTTVGRRLAKKLGLDFVDSDFEIEQAAGMSVIEIFEKYGEEDFRSGERRVMTRLLDGTPKVIATGGGAIINAETRALIKSNALTIWLDADTDILVERTGRRDTRPLLKEGNPEEILEKLAAERAPFYAEADLKIVSSEGLHDTVVNAILDALQALDEE
ncbi:MAG: shikimate kinase [Kordiimonadaceae bacterium]|nr:shikimate kinase [Kordiimonadaceae bacterium]